MYFYVLVVPLTGLSFDILQLVNWKHASVTILSIVSAVSSCSLAAVILIKGLNPYNPPFFPAKPRYSISSLCYGSNPPFGRPWSISSGTYFSSPFFGFVFQAQCYTLSPLSSLSLSEHVSLRACVCLLALCYVRHVSDFVTANKK